MCFTLYDQLPKGRILSGFQPVRNSEFLFYVLKEPMPHESHTGDK